jgi:hypothetical protein
MWRRTMGLLVLAVLVAVAAAGCGSSGQDGSTAAPATTTTTPPATTSSSSTTTASAAAARCSNGVLLEAAQAWAALDLGTGIDCAGSPIGPKLTAACKALGYP